ncbi:hypothetical protein ACVIW2_005071 [Bradyrhizobium huanghuaihaiense]
MRSVATLPLVATPSIAHSSGHLPAGDRRLVELAACVLEIIPLHKAAADREEAAWDEYNQRKPQRPAELRWHIGDPVGYDLEPTSPGRARSWCSVRAIEELRNTPLMKWEFIGTDEEWGRDESHSWDAEAHQPQPEAAHLWKKVPDLQQQPRVDQLIAALDGWNAAREKLERDLNIPALAARSSEFYDQLREAWEEMLTLSATTLEGMRAKAVVLYQSVWNGDARDQLGDTTDAEFIYSMVADLIGQQGVFGSARPGRVAVEA